jgi:hypothetical protein
VTRRQVEHPAAAGRPGEPRRRQVEKHPAAGETAGAFRDQVQDLPGLGVHQQALGGDEDTVRRVDLILP